MSVSLLFFLAVTWLFQEIVNVAEKLTKIIKKTKEEIMKQVKESIVIDEIFNQDNENTAKKS